MHKSGRPLAAKSAKVNAAASAAPRSRTRATKPCSSAFKSASRHTEPRCSIWATVDVAALAPTALRSVALSNAHMLSGRTPDATKKAMMDPADVPATPRRFRYQCPYVVSSAPANAFKAPMYMTPNMAPPPMATYWHPCSRRNRTASENT